MRLQAQRRRRGAPPAEQGGASGNYALMMAVKSGYTPQKGQNYSQLWSRFNQAVGEVEGVNLDRGDYFWSVYNELATLS